MKNLIQNDSNENMLHVYIKVFISGYKRDGYVPMELAEKLLIITGTDFDPKNENAIPCIRTGILAFRT